MATINPFDLLGDDDNDDPSQLIAAQQQKIVPKKAIAPTQDKAPQQKPAKLPTKPLPPAQAVREGNYEGGRGAGRGGGRGYGRGRGGFNRDPVNNENSFSSSAVSGGQGAPEDRDAGKPSERHGGYGGPRPYRGGGGGGRRGDFNNGEVGDGERPRRVYERHSGTGRGYGGGFKREGAGRGNWGTQTDELDQVTEEINEEKSLVAEKPSGEEEATDGKKEVPENEPEEKEPEEKEMTLEEYEKLLEEKRKALPVLKTEERKVDVKEFKSMQQISSKKENHDVFIKLGSDKDKKKELSEKEERAKKSVSINEFLKPAEGERFYGGRGRGGRGGGGRGFRGGFNGGGGGGSFGNAAAAPAPAIEDPNQFPSLGGK